MDFGQAEALFPAIREILQNRQLQPAELDLITVCCGPGSFTGVRSSLAAARTLGLALQKTALTGVSAFEAYVHDLAPEELAFTMPLLSKPNAKTFTFNVLTIEKTN